MSTFEAKYKSKCGICTSGIEPGEEVVRTLGEVVHAECPEPAAPASPAEEAPDGVCHRCWQAKSRSGACGCFGE